MLLTWLGKSANGPSRRSPRRSIPHLETLEGRLAPAILTVNTLADETTPDNYLSLREAIQVVDTQSTSGLSAAELNQISGTLGSNDTIQFDPSLYGQSALSGTELLISQNLTINGPGANVLRISGNNASRVFEVDSGNVTLSGMAIAGGSDSSGIGGGGVYNNGAALTVTNCTVSGNFGYSGGGLLNTGTLTVTNSTFSGNVANGDSNVAGGGGIYSTGTLTVTGCSFSGNSTTYIPVGVNENGGGGAIENAGGTLTLTDSTFSSNSVRAGVIGGAVYNRYGTSTATNCTFSGNSADQGGAIQNIGTLTMTNSTVSGNTVSVGAAGGIFNHGTLTMANCTISDNSAGAGGAIYNDTVNYYSAGTITMADCTISGNSAMQGGGIYNLGTVTTGNTIIAGNTASSGPDVYGAVTSQGYNLVGDGSGSSGFGAAGDQVGTDANPINPLLAPLGTYGGPTETLALLPGSPAIDAGSNALAADGSGNPLTTDQRGFARIVNGIVDIGAYESRGFSIAITGGNNQQAVVATAFAAPLSVTVSSPYEEPVQGGVVTFTAPASGPSAIFPGGNTASLGAAGQANLTPTANTVAGSYSVTASSNGAGSVTFTLTNLPAAASHLSITAPASITAGTSFSLTVTALDPYGNVATSYRGTIHFTSSDKKAVLPSNYTFTATDQAIHTFGGVKLKTAGSQTITATDTANGTITGQGAVTVNPAPASHLRVTAPAKVAVGVPFTITVTALDPYGNVATGYLGTIHFTSSDSQATLPADYPFTAADNGVHTFTNGVTPHSTGSRTVTATDTLHSTITGKATVNVVTGTAPAPVAPTANADPGPARNVRGQPDSAGAALLVQPLPGTSDPESRNVASTHLFTEGRWVGDSLADILTLVLSQKREKELVVHHSLTFG